MTAILIHLSDSHLQQSNQEVAQRYKEIGATIRPLLPTAKAVFIAWTGDIVYSGTAKEFTIAETFLLHLKGAIASEFDGPIEIVLTPGNHDGEFEDAKTFRISLIEQIVKDKNKAYDKDHVDVCVEPMKAYFNFQDRISNAGVSSSHPLWRDYRFQIGGKSIRFSSMNASWMTVYKENYPLVFPLDHFIDKQEDPATVNVLLIHHPLNWYAQNTYHPLRKTALSYYQIVMSGHEHQGGVITMTAANANPVVMLECSALDPTKGDSFCVSLLDIEDLKIATETFKWNPGTGTGKGIYDPGHHSPLWQNFRSLPKPRPLNGFHLTESIRAVLETMDASFLHPNKPNLALSDVFVYPEMEEVRNKKGNIEPITAEMLLSANEENKRVLVFGDDQFGKTSLLKQLFLDFYLRGYMPLMINAAEADCSPEKFSRVVNRRVEDAYGDEAVRRHDQTKFEDKIILVDDLDQVGDRGDVVARVVKNLERQFGRVIVTAADRFELTILHKDEAAEATAKYSQYKMLGFGYKLRYDLIRRWYSVGMESIASIQEQVNEAERIINHVLGKGLVPMTAFNTLVLLQSIQINDRRALANAGMAQYYEYMFRQSLMSTKVNANETDEIQNYLIHLAWWMFEHKVVEISFTDLFQFNVSYSREYFETDLPARLELLEQAKILWRGEDKRYSFAYSYLRYFFVAKYLASNAQDREDLSDRIKYLCNHIYLKENANIVLFLTAHLTSDWVIEEIAQVLNKILEDVPVLNITRDAVALNTFISEQAKLAVDATNVVENTRKIKQAEDEAEKRLPEPDVDPKVSSISELDLLSQINLLFKTSEILGQILKGRYGSIRNSMKESLMQGLFDAPLRAVSFFHQIVNEEPDALVREFTRRMKHDLPEDPTKAERETKLRLFQLMGGISHSFFSRQGEIIGSAKLIKTITTVANSTGDLTYRMVAVAGMLSIPNNPPIVEVRKLAHELENNVFGFALLQGLVARHLHMFHLPVAERTSLAAAVKIEVNDQREIEFKSQDQKKLPSNLHQPSHRKNLPSLLQQLQQTFLHNNPVDKLLNRYVKKKDDDDKVES